MTTEISVHSSIENACYFIEDFAGIVPYCAGFTKGVVIIGSLFVVVNEFLSY